MNAGITDSGFCNKRFEFSALLGFRLFYTAQTPTPTPTPTPSSSADLAPPGYTIISLIPNDDDCHGQKEETRQGRDGGGVRVIVRELELEPEPELVKFIEVPPAKDIQQVINVLTNIQAFSLDAEDKISRAERALLDYINQKVIFSRFFGDYQTNVDGRT